MEDVLDIDMQLKVLDPECLRDSISSAEDKRKRVKGVQCHHLPGNDTQTADTVTEIVTSACGVLVTADHLCVQPMFQIRLGHKKVNMTDTFYFVERL